MQRITMALSLAALLAAPSLALAGPNLPLESLPDAVRATAEREVGRGKITEIDRDREQGQEIYEVEFLLDGKCWELDIALDGRLLERKED